MSADDRIANVFKCTIGKLAGVCPKSASLGFLGRGKHVIRAQAMGPGTLLGTR